MLAEKIETREEYEECCSAGFDLFQGFFLSRPEVIHSKVACHQSGMLPVLARLNSSCSLFDELEEIVQSDADLCFRMMRYLDSSSIEPDFCSDEHLSAAYLQAVQAADVQMNEINSVPT